ncbi:MAG: histidinol dehydrogenase [Rhodobacteraceae bacterium]|nr:histidinol dehydrogenase [Paracoccaceae bacterium]
MVYQISTSQPDFEDRFSALLSAKREDAADVDAAAREIVAEVRTRGDAALIEYTERFDHVTLTRETLAYSAEEIDAGAAGAPTAEVAALELAAARIEKYHQRQLPEDARWTDEAGMEMGWRWTPVDAAGLYVPGGAASYPSSVLMNAIPARMAGVKRLAMCAPAPRGEMNPLVLAAAKLAGVTEIYRLGGAQAIAAMAYGTQSLAPVDVVVGPGNAYVAAAKRQVFGRVGIDSIAGPSEVVVIADADNDPDWLAMDLMAQAEHDTAAQSILITPDPDLAEAAPAAVLRALETLPRREIAEASWNAHGAVILCVDLDEAARLADRLAAEHLQICVADPEPLAARIRHAGAMFLGRMTPEALGDYAAGPNHVLPTSRAARYASGLSTLAFMKRTTVLKATPEALAAVGPAAEILAVSEGLDAHARSVALRLRQLNTPLINTPLTSGTEPS